MVAGSSGTGRVLDAAHRVKRLVSARDWDRGDRILITARSGALARNTASIVSRLIPERVMEWQVETEVPAFGRDPHHGRDPERRLLIREGRLAKILESRTKRTLYRDDECDAAMFGPLPELYCAKGPEDEADWIARRIRPLLSALPSPRA